MSAARAVSAAAIAAALLGCHPAARPPAPPPGASLARPVVTLHEGRRPGLTVSVPRAALVRRGGVPGVFVLSASGKARFRMVGVGRTGATSAGIVAGLRGDETLVLGDLSAVHDGTPIRPLARGRAWRP